MIGLCSGGKEVYTIVAGSLDRTGIVADIVMEAKCLFSGVETTW